jgi:Tfp pilus assembly ATPase PilU
MQLAMTLGAIVSQRLVKTSDGKGRVAVVEIMINTPTIRKLIEEGNTGRIDKVIADSASLYRMQTQNQHLLRLVNEGLITKEDALKVSNNPNDLKIMFQTRMPSAEAKTEEKPSSEEQGSTGSRPSLGRRPFPFARRSPGTKDK